MYVTGAFVRCSWTILLTVACTVAAAADKLEYNRDIRPILNDTCFACHGPDSAARKADLRLDKREVAVAMGAITPGEPDHSVLLDRIFSDDAEEVMPPPSTKKALTVAQRETLRRWIVEGAEYQPHWSYIKPERPATPAVQQQAWIRNPIDAFVLAKLEARGLTPAAEADRRTLARRLSLDLTGLPPQPELVEAFVNDLSGDAYEKIVDQMLASPHWGEHRGRYWLDAARYADTHGIHFDNFREMWSYRDWVINAFNRNQPFDQFTIEQLAGDLLPNRTLEQQVASGFNRCNMTTNEGGIIDEEYLVLYTRDRTETTSQVWLGLTAGCAVCHDHKFDLISQREFYEMAAFFNNTTQAARDGNIQNTPPIVPVPQASDAHRLPSVAKELADTQRQLEARKNSARDEFEQWLASNDAARLAPVAPTEGLVLHAPLSEGFGNTVDFVINGKTRPVAGGNLTWENGQIAAKAVKVDGNIQAEFADVGDFDNNESFTVAVWVKFTDVVESGAIVGRMDEANGYRGWDVWVEGGRIGMHVINSWQQNAVKNVANSPLPLNQWHHVLVSYDGSGKAAGIKIYYDGQEQPASPQANSLNDTARTNVPLKLAQRNNSARISNLLLQDLRIYNRGINGDEIQSLGNAARIRALVQKPVAERNEAERTELVNWWLESVDDAYRQLRERNASLVKEEADINARGTIAHVMQERGELAMAFILQRGDYEKRKDQVKADTIDMLPPMAEDLPRNRLGFAWWLLMPEHPLTARVTVNRFWQEVFGTGIVRTSGDFGVSGELPANQELLDWLAVEFRESGWDIKKFFKLLVTSATYRQAAIATPDKLDKDAHNRYLSRGPRFRMDAEMVRDYGLAVSGLLVPKLGGPSVKPYMPEGVWEAVAMIGSNTRDYKPDSGDGLYRRSLYTFWKRAAPPASMDIFNAPSREVCTVRRERTNTPLQALMTLNDVQMIEAARKLAENAIKSAGDDDARIDAISKRLLARPLRPDEAAVVKSSLGELKAYYEAHKDDAAKLIAVGESKPDDAVAPDTLAAWTMLTNQLMNLDEVLNK